MKSIKKISMLLIVLAVLVIAVLAFYKEAPALKQSAKQKNLNPYQELAVQSDLIFVGTVTSVDFNREVFGWAGDNKPYYATFQYVMITIDELIKGIPRTNPIIIQATASFSDDPKFTANEKVLVMAKWWEDKNHGNYYALSGGGVAGKFLIVNDILSSQEQVVNEKVMGNTWKMKIVDFVADIKTTIEQP